MVKSTVVTSLILVLVFLLSFFIWHFFLSIYEVKFNTSVNGSILNCNSELTIKTIGVNSLGWELPFRTIESKVEIIDGNDLIELFQFENSIVVKTLSTEGQFTIKVIPKLSLNPTQFSCNIMKYD